MSDTRSAAVPASDDAEVGQPPSGGWPSPRPRWVPVLRALLLTVVGLGVLSWILLTPRAGSAQDFLQDLRAGDVRSYQFTSMEDAVPYPGLFVDDNGSDSDPHLVWCSATYDCHRVDASDVAFLDDMAVSSASAEETDQPSDEQSVVRRVIRDQAANDPPTIRTNASVEWLSQAMGITFLALLVVLITGWQPRRSTKWAAFWLLLLPGGLGMLWILVREAPWSRQMAALPEPATGLWSPGRWTGGWTFIAVALLSNLVLNLPDVVWSAIP